MATTVKDPDALPGQEQVQPGSNLKNIREAARTKKALLEVQQLEKKINEPEPEPAPQKPKLPSPPQRTLSIDQLITYWSGIDQTFRPRLLGYLYRLWPIITRSPGYIDKLAEPPAEVNEILRQWGTGEYELMLTDLDKPKNGQICKARFKFSERIDEYPPVLDAVDLDIARKENASYVTWARSKGLLRMQTEQTTGNDGAVATVLAKALVDQSKKEDPTAAASKASVQMMADANKVALEMVQKQNDPRGIADVIKAVKELMPTAPAAPASDPRIDLLIAQMNTQAAELKAERQANRDLQKQMLDLVIAQHSGKDKSTISGIRELAETVAVIKEAFGGGDGGPKEWWQMLEPHIGEGMEVLKNVSDAVKFAASRPASRPQRPPVQMPVAGLPPQPQQTEAEASAANPAEPNQDSAEQPAAGGPPMELIQFFAQVSTPFMVHLKRGGSGYEFGETLSRDFDYTLEDHAKIKRIGKTTIVEMVKSSPAWLMIQPYESRFLAFIDEFLDWPDAGGGPADPVDDMPPPPPLRRPM